MVAEQDFNGEDADLTEVAKAISPARLQEYLDEVGGSDLRRAIDLYTWNARMAAEAFALIGHTEVLLRNKLDEALKRAFKEEENGIPWFLQLGVPGVSDISDAIAEVRNRNRALGHPDSRDRVIAGLSFGTWGKLLANNELWSGRAQKAFPLDTKKKHVTGLVERIRQTRNRVAHQNYVNSFDLPSRMRDVLELAALLSPEYEEWMRAGSNWEEIYRSRPEIDMDTVIVAGREAWEVYNATSVYVCRPGRYFRDVQYLGFYEQKSIRRQIPRIREIRDDVPWNLEEAERLEQEAEGRADEAAKIDKKIAQAIRWSQTEEGQQIEGDWAGWDGKYKVFVLTGPRDQNLGKDQHLLLGHDIPHRTSGRGSAFTQGQRYVSTTKLHVAKTTDDLIATPDDPA